MANNLVDFTEWKWLNESRMVTANGEIVILAPANTDWFNNPVPENGVLSVPVANALVYTGEAQALVSGEGWLYSLDGETYSADIPTAVDAGDYTVYYKTAEDAEAQTMTVTVAKADVVLVIPEAMNGVA